jgi:integrase
MRRNYNWPHQIAVVADPDFLVEIIFAAASELRAGEHHALRWRHIGFNRREVDVETRVDAYNEEDAPRSAAGMRTVPLGDVVLKHLREWKLRSKWSNADDLAFSQWFRQLRSSQPSFERQILSAVRKARRIAQSRPCRAPAGAEAVHMAFAAAFRGVMLDRGTIAT